MTMRAAIEVSYPDIGDILALKAKGRAAQASLSIADKLALLDKIRNNAAVIVGRRADRAQRTHDERGRY
jgi:hypothetical protein